MIKRIIEFLKFQTYLGGSFPARELPTKILTRDEMMETVADLKKLFPSKKSKIKVAIDESIGAALAKKIEVRGYQIVCRAGHAETDESWMKRALAAGAVFIISPDLDIPSMIERENLPMVWIDFLFAGYVFPKLSAEMPKEQKHAIWSQYLHDRIQSKLKFLNKEFGGDL
jgi:hypothetical protein